LQLGPGDDDHIRGIAFLNPAGKGACRTIFDGSRVAGRFLKVLNQLGNAAFNEPDARTRISAASAVPAACIAAINKVAAIVILG
jgi:hypothetical protein